MKLSRSLAVVVGACLVLAPSGSRVAAQGQAPSQIDVWTPLPVKPNPFVPPHKPWTKLSEVIAKHKGQQNWSELIVDDNLFHGEYISMAPGAKTPRRFHQDNRAFWFVQDGQIRFTIEGQEPFVATKGFLVQVPKRLVYSMETVGDKPSLRFEVLMANSRTMYPADETPPPTPGIRFEKTRVPNSKGSYDEANVPYIDFNLTIAGKQKPKKNPTQFIGDAHDGNYVNVGIANILRGDPKTQAPAVPGDKGTCTSPVRSSGSSSKGRWNSRLAQCRPSSPIKGTSSTRLRRCGIRCDSRAPRWRQGLLSWGTRFRTCFQGKGAPTARYRPPPFPRSADVEPARSVRKNIAEAASTTAPPVGTRNRVEIANPPAPAMNATATLQAR
jgi:mannose-6-phosphate isomerase-like protein (cupin superfamily)